ncbi:autotransporter-associated beta strand repeat-containing protein, partial [Achromobacter sp. GG226]|uniref:SGNH/GDSL hydrolase family protein n=1 Tax=Verticiella alkaliphila TaxID=2779529 RepID=UPI001C0B02F1
MRKVLPTLTLVFVSSVVSAQPYSAIWSVGDSLSDTGRTFARSTFLHRPQPKGDLYWQGRFSNGGVWVEHLHRMNALTYDPSRNLAWGGAVTGSARDILISAVVKHLEEQVKEDLRPKIDGTTSGWYGTLIGLGRDARLPASAFGERPLVTLWIGGNNFRQQMEDSDWHPLASASDWRRLDIPRDAVLAGVPENLRRINDGFLARPDVGQQGVTYYVPTVPDVGATPKFSSPEWAHTRTALSAAVRDTNHGLKRTLYALEDEFKARQPNTRIVVVDAAALLAEVQRDPQAFGFKIGDQNCVDSDSGRYTNGCSADNVGDYLFWDPFHPTTKAHEMIAKYASDTDKAEAGQAIALTFPYVANIELRARDFNGDISGTGSLIKQGEQTLQLRGTNTYTGGTRIDQGALRVSTDANLGAPTGQLLMRGGTLNSSASFTMTRDVQVNGADAKGTFGGTFDTDAGTVLTLRDNTLHGQGNIAKTGQGTLDLRATVADARELTSVDQGLLKINTTNDYRSTEVVVQPNGTLGGSGTIVGKVVNHGRIAPGNSIGTLTIEGDYEQTASGTYVLDVDTHRSDTFHVTGTKIVDGTVHVVLEPSAKMLDQRFTVVTASGGIQGEYDEVTDLSPFLSQTLHHGTHAVDVSFARDFHAPVQTDNQRTLATYLGNAFSTQAQGDLDAIYHALDNTVTDAGGRAALEALSGSTLGNLTVADAFQRVQTVRAIEDRLAERRAGRDTGLASGAAAGAVGSDASGMASTLRAAAQSAGTGLGRTAAWARVLAPAA